jgi:hypothetical protein
MLFKKFTFGHIAFLCDKIYLFLFHAFPSSSTKKWVIYKQNNAIKKKKKKNVAMMIGWINWGEKKTAVFAQNLIDLYAESYAIF